MRPLVKLLATLTLGALTVSLETSQGAAGSAQKLSGSQILAKFAGMQVTDEVHWRFVYDRDGRLRSYSMGTEKIGKWIVEKDELCLYVEESDDGCYEVSLSGRRVEMKPSGLGATLEGFLQTAGD